MPEREPFLQGLFCFTGLPNPALILAVKKVELVGGQNNLDLIPRLQGRVQRGDGRVTEPALVQVYELGSMHEVPLNQLDGTP